MKPLWSEEVRADLVIVGGGAAGLSVALGAGGARVHLLARQPLGEGVATGLAQGGIAAAVGVEDSPALHLADTLAAAAGLAEPAAVRTLVEAAPAAIARLIAAGARFDRDADGSLALTREAAHSRRRVLHAEGDATGRELLRALAAAVTRRPGVHLFNGATALALLRAGERVCGLLARPPDGRLVLHRAGAVLLATGGSGALYLHTTNPGEADGGGLWLAARAGALLADLEFVQFHPTALATGSDPLPLLTEALRGEGAAVIDERGERFLAAVHPAAELAPRDVVARGIWTHRAAGHQTFLDARESVGERFPERFPSVFRACREAGFDPRREPLPVVPAAHYQMGGILTSCDGRSSLAGLWAAGEVASTGVHGANRLASNSLLEAVVFGARAAADILAAAAPPLRPATGEELCGGESLPDPGRAAAPRSVRERMWQAVGLVRRGEELAAAAAALAEAAARDPGRGRPAAVAALVAAAALARRESRGAHYRADFPEPDPAGARHTVFSVAFTGGRPEPRFVDTARPRAAGGA
ncbi:MAG TPA: L-aspartate oxidase [Thermoanaerobaculia bacterium]|nr:L-aspartate oxidase [Thermoanaerobaculia bacterium]